MALTETFEVGVPVDSLYVPFRGQNRVSGPVGTLQQRLFDVGDAGGGTVLLTLTCPRVIFGFHPILVLTQASVVDSLGTAEPVMLTFSLEGNERLLEAVRVHGRNVKNAGGINATNYPREDLLILIEPDQVSAATIMQFTWDTNTNTVIYRVSLNFMVYDAEQLARVTDVDYGGLLL